MLRKFRITVNEKTYMVEMEELGVAQGAGPISAPVTTAPAVSAQVMQTAPVAVPVIQAAPVAIGKGETMEAPMPGNILDVFVRVGDRVTENQPLFILEAMKMENEIVAPKNGTVTAVHVVKGTPIDVGAPMVTIA